MRLKAVNIQILILLKQNYVLCFVFFSIPAGGLLFVNPMRDRNYMTMLDPFYDKYGKVITAGLSLVSLSIDVIWVATTLTGLGKYYRPGGLMSTLSGEENLSRSILKHRKATNVSINQIRSVG